MKKRAISFALFIALCLSLSISAFAAASISLDKTVYAPGEKITVTSAGITQEMVDAAAFVAIYAAGAAHTEWGTYDYPEVGSDVMYLTAPAEKGAYEMRLYDRDHEYTDAAFVMKVSFTVGDVAVKNPGKIALDKDTYTANTLITVRYSEITQQMQDDEAFIAIYEKGGKHTEWGNYAYAKAGSGTAEILAPNLNGDFEMRLYTQDHFYSDATFVMAVPFKLTGAKPITGSDWAQGELQDAEALGLIPDSLKSADLTRPVTREEFCELAILLYTKCTGNDPAPVSPNPFKDTTNTQILKAFTLGITKGTTDTTFEPGKTITREQCAAMLFRAIQAMKLPNVDYSTAGVPDFPDQKDIATYAVEAAKYMSKLGIIKGNEQGLFMPKAVTVAQEAAGYGTATREAAILMSIRTYGKLNP
jgi:hypothetical protein